MQNFVKRQHGQNRLNSGQQQTNLSATDPQSLKLPVHNKLVRKPQSASDVVHDVYPSNDGLDDSKNQSKEPNGHAGESNGWCHPELEDSKSSREGSRTATETASRFHEQRNLPTLNAGNEIETDSVSSGPNSLGQREGEEQEFEDDEVGDLEYYQQDDANDLDLADAMMHNIVSSMTQSQREMFDLDRVRVGFNPVQDHDAQSYPTTTSGGMPEDDRSEDDFKQYHQPLQATNSRLESRPRQQLPRSGVSNIVDQRKHRDAHIAEANKSYKKAEEARRQRAWPPTAEESINADPSSRKRTAAGLVKQTESIATEERQDISEAGGASDFVRGRSHKKNILCALESKAASACDQQDEQAKIQSETAALDYDIETLYKMPFSKLREEAFDDSPNDKPSVVPADKVSAPLPQRLEFISNQNADDQARFFASITQKEWEESGDWFTEKFRHLASELMRSRQERRRIAQHFEDEIAQRYEAVTKASDRLDQSLKDMKEKGNLVLPSCTSRKP